ncbi:hypothetical protein B5D77_09365 [Microcystis sp. MC19]|uniref:LamG-like jellyroll fold domain-containing protein n=1 Tax=Microcystis sp. MC19 TaxID=1967666 RepID=UPI000D12461B|nr:LamG-like jellyroll fold domain-containing protein [Microcystis sp. MC19]AVQ71486.1 hypothetical protein B5D77_09365 [Microcystis sp. MC19]
MRCSYPAFLISNLNQELTNKSQDLVVQIDLTNDQQEQGIETNLQKYIEQKQNSIVKAQEAPLTAIRETFEQPNRALFFDGVNDYIQINLNEPETEVTHELWFKTTSLNGGLFSVVAGNLGSGGHDRHIYLSNGNIVVRIWNNEVIASSGLNLADGKWHHVAHVFGASVGGQQIYVDGQLVASGSRTISDFGGQDKIVVGYSADSGYFKGEIDEVRVWNVAKTQAQIQTYYNRNLTGKEQGLLGYWNFEEATGNTVNDLTANKNNGTLTNGVQRTVANTNLITRPEGKTLYFDGVNDYINAGTNPSLKVTNTLTLEAWINPQQDSRTRMIVGREGEYLLALSGADNIIYYALANSNPGWNWISTGYGVKSNQWSHVAFSYENGRIKTYVNGQLIYTYDGVGTIGDVDTNQNELRIGNRQWSNTDFFKGQIDEVRIWNTVKAQAEIQANLSQKLIGNEQGLVGYWNFEEATGNTVNDLTANKNNGTLINGVQRTVANTNLITRPEGKALYFDGVNDYTQVGAKSSLVLTDKFTLEAWINPVKGADQGIILNKEGEYEIARFSDGTIRWYFWANPSLSNDWINTGYIAPENQWTHVALTYDKNIVKIYANGELIQSYETSATLVDGLTTWNDFRIGGRQGFTGPGNYFKGQIDDVRVWNVARTQAEIQANLSQKLTGNEQGLVGYWNFEESAGNTVNDLTANKNNGTLTNGVQRTVANSNPITRPEGKALYFDGVNDYTQVGAKSSLVLTDKFTLEAWINPVKGADQGIILNKEGEYEIARFSDGTIRWYFWANPSLSNDWINTGYIAPENQWTHVALTYDKNIVKIYANGELIQSYETSATLVDGLTTWNDFRIGGRQGFTGPGNYFKGQIDDVRVWNVARTQAEIQANLSQKLTGNEQGLVGYWNFEESAGNTVNDLTANKNNGTLTNGVQRTVANSNPITRPEGKALYFDGVNDSIQMNLNEPETEVTHELWFKTTSLNGGLFSVIAGSGGHDRSIHLSNGNIVVRIWNNEVIASSGLNLADGKWHHVAHVFGASVGGQQIYVDGQLVASGSRTVSDFNWQDKISIGYSADSGYFKGEIDEVRVWNVAKTQSQIQASLNQKLTGNEQGLIGYWNFEENTGNTVNDLTANKNNGTLTNGVQRTIDSSIAVPQVVTEQTNIIESKTIANLQSLRLETAYLTLQSQQNPDKVQNYLTEYQFNQLTQNNTNQTPTVQKLADNNLIGDFNNDQINDTYHHWNVSGINELYLGNSNGTFTKYVNPISTTAINESPTNVFTGDFNGDGKTDIYFYWKASGRNRLYFSNGNGTFTQYLDPIGALAINGSPDNTFIADFNGDGKQDAYFHWKSSGTNRLYISNGNGTFTQYLDPITATVINGSPDNAFIADFNGDGKQDAYFHWKSSGTNRLYISNGNGTFTQYLDPITTTLINGSPDQVQVNDFNNDGKIDIRFQWTSSNTIRTFLNTGNSTFSQALSAQELLNKYFPELNNPTTLATLQQQISDQQTQSQQQIDQLKNSISQKQAEAAASISQADWYQEKSAFYWERSRKQGPTWIEWRSYQEKKWYGRKQTKQQAITHVDHDWIIWDTYTKQATALREHAAQLLKGVETDTLNKDTTTTILNQWNKANAVANEAALSQSEFIHLLQQLEAERKLSEDKIAQISDWEKLLPILQNQLQIATQDAATATANIQKETGEYQTSKDNYLTALNSVLQKRAELQTQTQLLQQDITTAKNWVTQQTIYLTDELTQAKTLITQLQTQRDLLPPTSLDNGGDENLTKKAQLDQSIQLLTQKQTVLTSQQATLTQKQTLLSTQEQVLLTEYQLLDATLASPDKDTSTLEQQLTDTRKTLAEVQKLAEQAEASSQALTAVMDDLQASLLLQNDKYLAAIKDKQQGLKKLLEATELEKNYTLQATTKRQELNSFESQLLTILKQANDAGSQEAAQLLEVANANNMATAAELYYKDYRDLASDKGGGCSGGIARPEDLILADKYYAEMQQYRQLQQQAQQQASQFTALRQAAENQITLLEGQKALATQELAQLQQSIGNSQEAIEAHKQEIAVAEFRIDALSQLKDWTNQTLLQVLSVEKFNLAQAQLEQEIAEKRGQLIDDAVAAQLEKQRLDIQRDRQIAVTKLEQLNQLNTEEALQQAINNLRTDLGINPIANIITQADYKGQLAGILADLDALKQKQPSLPAELESILTATRQDIHAALQGKEAATIQDNLLKTVDGLIEQNNKLNAEVTKLDQEEQQYLGILKQSETDLKGASKALYEEIQKTGVLTQEKELLSQQNLEILSKVGYAQGAVDLSDDLARQSQQLLSQIIEGRVKERRIRKKAFVNEVLGTAALVIAIASAVITAGASLYLYATTAATLGASLAAASSLTVVTTLNVIGASISAVQSAYNGDWAGAVFHAAMAFASYEISDINSELAKNPQVIETTKAIDVAKEAKDLSLVGELTQKLELLKYELSPNLLNLTRFQTVAQGAYSSYQYAKTGDTTLALLSGVQSLANAASLGIKDITKLSQASDIQKFFITAGQVSLVTAQGIKAIENGNWLDAANAIGKIAGQIDKNFALGLGEAGKKELIDLTGLKWEEIQDFGKLSSALYQTIDNKDWIKAIQTAGKAINLVDDSLLGVDLGTEAHKAIKDLTGFEWEEVETIIQSGVKLEIAVRERNLQAITQSVKSIVNVWVTDEKLKIEAQKVTGLSWEEIQRITQTGEAINKAIEKGDTAAWIKSSNELLGIWQGNQTLQNFLKTNLNLDWKDFQQVVKAGQSIAIATDKQSVEQWGQSLKEVLNIWYDDDTLKNKLTTVSGLSWEQIQKTEETISTLNKAYEQGNSLAWIEASNKILKLWETDQTLANKIKVNTGLDWQDFEKIVKAGQATAIAVDSEKLKDWGQAIRKVANIWADDATLKSKIEQATGLTWSQLNKLENTVQELDKATQNNNTQSWITASDNILTIWKTDPSFAKKLKEVTSLDFTDLEKIVKAGQASATAIDSQEIAKWGQAIRRVANIWVDDNTLKSTAEDLTGLSWEKLQKLDKTVQAINTAINKDTTQDWINASDAILKIWQDDPTLTQKLTTYTNLNWQDIENIVKAGQEIAKAVDQQTLAQWGNAIKSAVNIWVDNNTLTQAEKATGLTWVQLENLVLTNRLIKQAIDTNDLETWKKSTDEIINIWKEDKVLTQKLKEKAGIEWKDIEYIVKSGQAIATASQDTTLENLTAAIEQIVSIGDQEPQLKEKIRSIFELEWQKLEAISQKNQQIQADLAQQQQENWVTTNQELINILEKNDALIQENLAPIIINPIPNQTATTNKLFTFTVAETTFTDIDKNDFLTYSATDVNGNSLPKWLSFDPKTRTFSGTSKDTTSSSVDIKIEAKDTKGLSSSNVFILTINAISNATIETFGNTKLVQDATNKLYTQIGNNNPTAIKNGVTHVATNTYPGWQILAAETVNGINQVLLRNTSQNLLYIWNLDNNWNWQSSQGGWNLNSTQAFNQETNFKQDFNGDNQIGNPLPIIGSSDNDILSGTLDNDILIGGLGNDTLTGGAGGDRFTFNNRNEGIDTITDFLSSQGDKIALSAAGFGGGLAAGVAITSAQFVLGTTALNASNRFIYNTITGGLFFDGDGTGTLAAIQIVTLSSKPTISASDILVLV